MAQALPFISVVVPAFQRPEGLRRLLEALAEQSYPPTAFEVLIADDGSVPPLSSQIEARQYGLSWRFLRAPNAGPAAARDRAWREARGSVIAFTDDDCIPEPTWLEAIGEAFTDPKQVHTQGPVWSETPPIEGFVHSLVLLSEAPGVATANYAVRRQALQAVGGFDLAYQAPYFEDEDLARRLVAKHGPPLWMPEMMVHHPPKAASWASLWRGAGFFFYLPHHRRKHPGAWVGAIEACRRRVALKIALLAWAPLALGLAEVGGRWGGLGAMAWAWGLGLGALGPLGLVAWQLKRLGPLRAQAKAGAWPLAWPEQLRFVLAEWLLDFRRLGAYQAGLRYHPEAPPAQADDPLAGAPVAP